MDLLQSILLGIVQGLAEPLPISSSGHLIVVPWLLGWPAHSLTYDVALHMGTLAALLTYFWRDWWRLAAAWLPAQVATGDWQEVGAITWQCISTGWERLGVLEAHLMRLMRRLASKMPGGIAATLASWREMGAGAWQRTASGLERLGVKTDLMQKLVSASAGGIAATISHSRRVGSKAWLSVASGLERFDVLRAGLVRKLASTPAGGTKAGAIAVEAPPVEAPPVEAPPVEAPPVEAPPTQCSGDDQRRSGTAAGAVAVEAAPAIEAAPVMEPAPPRRIVLRPIPREYLEEQALRRRLGISLVAGTVPAAVIGAVFAEKIEQSLRVPELVALILIVAGALLAAADRAGVQKLGLEAVGITQALVIGTAQALALAPGVSRSGITIAAALFLGLTRDAAARYGFLLAAPITAGAGIFQLRHLLRDGIPPDERAAFVVGVITSFVVGMLAIGGLLRYLRTRNLDVFVAYRLALGILILAVAALRLR